MSENYDLPIRCDDCKSTLIDVHGERKKDIRKIEFLCSICGFKAEVIESNFNGSDKEWMKIIPAKKK